VSVHPAAFRGFANPVDPSPAELRAWAYNPDSVVAHNMPPEWDLLVAGDPLVNTLMELALDRSCPARRFALHCLYIYAADAIRTKFRAHPKRRLRRLVEKAEDEGDELLVLWAHNTRMLLAMPELFDYRDWCEGGLVRQPRRLRAQTGSSAPAGMSAPAAPLGMSAPVGPHGGHLSMPGPIAALPAGPGIPGPRFGRD
jgi:hypothetical protein